MPDVARRPSVWSRLAALGWRHRVLMAVWVVVGLAAGILASVLTPTTYVAESRLLVGTFEAPSAQIPGYVLTSQTVAANYARLAGSSTVIDRLSDDKLSPAQILSMVTVNSVPESAIIRVVATSKDADDARRASQAMATALNDAVTALNTTGTSDDVLQQYQTASQDLATAVDAQKVAATAAAAAPNDATAQHALAAANLAVSTAQLKVAGLDARYKAQQESVSTSSKVQVLGDATVTTQSNLIGTVTYVTIGVVLGAAIGLLLAARRERRAQAEPSEGDDEVESDHPEMATGRAGR